MPIIQIGGCAHLSVDSALRTINGLREQVKHWNKINRTEGGKCYRRPRHCGDMGCLCCSYRLELRNAEASFKRATGSDAM